MREPLGLAATMSYPVLTLILESEDSLTMQLNFYITDYAQTSYLLINSMLTPTPSSFYMMLIIG